MNTTEPYEYPWIGKPIQQWLDFFELIRDIEKTNVFGVTKFLEKTEDGTWVLPFTQPFPVVKEFNDRAYELGIIIDFEWHRWPEGGQMLNDINTDFDALSIESLLKLITVMVRADRFHDGYLVTCFEEGYVLAILQALQPKIIALYKTL